jgi:hypothetical protein
MERFILHLQIVFIFTLTVVFLSSQSNQNEYNDYKAPVSEDRPVKNESKSFYPPTKTKPYTRTTWKV